MGSPEGSSVLPGVTGRIEHEGEQAMGGTNATKALVVGWVVGLALIGAACASKGSSAAGPTTPAPSTSPSATGGGGGGYGGYGGTDGGASRPGARRRAPG